MKLDEYPSTVELNVMITNIPQRAVTKPSRPGGQRFACSQKLCMSKFMVGRLLRHPSIIYLRKGQGKEEKINPSAVDRVPSAPHFMLDLPFCLHLGNVIETKPETFQQRGYAFCTADTFLWLQVQKNTSVSASFSFLWNFMFGFANMPGELKIWKNRFKENKLVAIVNN